MEITGIKNIHPTASKASSQKGWKLTNSLREKVTVLAREDAAQGVYMGNKFLALRKSEVTKVAPDRAVLMGKVSQRITDMGNMKQIEEADRRWSPSQKSNARTISVGVYSAVFALCLLGRSQSD